MIELYFFYAPHSLGKAALMTVNRTYPRLFCRLNLKEMIGSNQLLGSVADVASAQGAAVANQLFNRRGLVRSRCLTEQALFLAPFAAPF